MRRLLGKLTLALRRALGVESVRHKGVVLPASHLRFGGPEFRNDDYFLRSAREEAERLVKRLGMTKDSCVVDIGCGVGRLAIGILSSPGGVGVYRGVDVGEQSIRWCKRYIERGHSNFRFIHVDVRNPRYHPEGRPITEDFRLPLAAESCDIVYLYSVFSHMLTTDLKAYLSEFARLLVVEGRVFYTAFVEQGVPQVSVNPPGYRMPWRGPLHGVRYEQQFLQALIVEAGFRVDDWERGVEAGGQTGIYLTKC